MENNSIISDNELRDLLKQTFLEDGENNVLTQKLIDMEAKLVFASTPVIAVPLLKEKEMIAKLGKGLGSKINSIWLFGGIGMAVIATITVLKLVTTPVENTNTSNNTENTLNSNKKPEQNTNALAATPENENTTETVQKTVFNGEIKTENILLVDTPRRDTEKQVAEKLTVFHSNADNDTTTPITPVTPINPITPNQPMKALIPLKAIGQPPHSQGEFIAVPPVVSLIKHAETITAKTVTRYKCRILDVKSLCDIPDTLKTPFSGAFTGEHTTYGCTTMDKKKFKLVMLSIEINAETKLTLETGFKNIVLAFKDGGHYQRPVAIEGNGFGLTTKSSYIQNNIIVQKMASKYKERIDLLFVFANAEPGDKILFNNLIEAVIEK